LCAHSKTGELLINAWRLLEKQVPVLAVRKLAEYTYQLNENWTKFGARLQIPPRKHDDSALQ
jgi:hypothetical protein